MKIREPDESAAVPPTIAAFLAEIAELARSVEPPVADLLQSGRSSEPARPWTRSRRHGLEVCLSMLRYIREDAARGDIEQRLDSAIAHIERQLELDDEPAERRPG